MGSVSASTAACMQGFGALDGELGSNVFQRNTRKSGLVTVQFGPIKSELASILYVTK